MVDQVKSGDRPVRKQPSEALKRKRESHKLSAGIINEVVSKGLGIGVTALNVKYPFTAAFTQMLQPTIESALKEQGTAAAASIEDNISKALLGLIQHDKGLQKAPTDHGKEHTKLEGQLKLKDGDDGKHSVAGAIGTHLLDTLLGRIGEKATDLSDGVADKIKTDGILDSNTDLQDDKTWSSVALALAGIALGEGTGAEKLEKLVGEGVNLVKGAVTDGVKSVLTPTTDKKDAEKLLGTDGAKTERTPSSDAPKSNRLDAELGNRTNAARSGSASGQVGTLVDGLAALFGLEAMGEHRRPSIEALKSSAVVARNTARKDKRTPTVVDLAKALAQKIVDGGGAHAASAAAMLKVIETQDPADASEGDIAAAGSIALDLLESVTGLKVQDRSKAAEVAETLLGTIEGVNPAAVDREKLRGEIGLLPFLTMGDSRGSAEAIANMVSKALGGEELPEKVRNAVITALMEVFGADGPKDNFQVLEGAIDFLKERGITSPALDSNIKILSGEFSRLGEAEAKAQELHDTVLGSVESMESRIAELVAKSDEPPEKAEATQKLIAGKQKPLAEAKKKLAFTKEKLGELQAERAKLQDGLNSITTDAINLVPQAMTDPDGLRSTLDEAATKIAPGVAASLKDLLSGKSSKSGGGGGDGTVPPNGKAKADDGGHTHQDPKYGKLLKDRARVCGEILDDPALNVVDKILLFLYMFAKYSDEEQMMLLKDFADAKNQETEWQQRGQQIANRRVGHEGNVAAFTKTRDQLVEKMASRAAEVKAAGGDTDTDPQMIAMGQQGKELGSKILEEETLAQECGLEELRVDTERPAFDTDVLESRIRRSRDLRSQMLQLANDIAEEEKRVLERINRM